MARLRCAGDFQTGPLSFSPQLHPSSHHGLSLHTHLLHLFQHSFSLGAEKKALPPQKYLDFCTDRKDDVLFVGDVKTGVWRNNLHSKGHNDTQRNERRADFIPAMGCNFVIDSVGMDLPQQLKISVRTALTSLYNAHLANSVQCTIHPTHFD